MIKKTRVEPISRKTECEVARFLTREEITAVMDRVADQVRCNMEYFDIRFPSSAARNQAYGIIDSIEWAGGFWTGFLWLCYEYAGEGVFKELVLKDVGSFLNRVEKHVELNHHDLDFLYSLPCVAGYRLIGSEEGRKAGLLAVDKLMEWFQEKGGFVQAWGELGARDNYRLITNHPLNISLLHWAPLGTGSPVYRNVTLRYYEMACSNIVKDDAPACHTFCSDSETGESFKSVTRQECSDDSAWARGQAWGICGTPLNYRYVKDYLLHISPSPRDS